MRIESVVVVGCNLFITQKIWKKILTSKTCKGQRGMYLGLSELPFEEDLLLAFYARLELIQSATLSIPLISRVFGPYVNYGPSFFPSIYGPSAKRAGHKKNEDP